MPKIQLAEVDYGPTWNDMVWQYGNPLDGDPKMSRLPRLNRSGEMWRDFFTEEDFTMNFGRHAIVEWPTVEPVEEPTKEVTS